MLVSERTTNQIERNNRVFRGANERIDRAAQAYDHELELIPFLCECPVENCVEVVQLSGRDYADVRANPRFFITAPSHEETERPLGHVVARRDGYVVVQKQE